MTFTHPNPARAAAVARLVEAVGRWRCQFGFQFDSLIFEKEINRNVVSAYDALLAIPLEVPTEPKARTAAPLTSHWAARSMRNSTLHGRILRAFHQADRRSIGWTVEELENALGIRHQTCSPRIHELRNAGWVYAPGDTRQNASGREAEVYVLTSRGVYVMWEAKRAEENP